MKKIISILCFIISFTSIVFAQNYDIMDIYGGSATKRNFDENDQKVLIKKVLIII